MRKSVTYRHITLAIGILVALLIALTLWTAAPAEIGSRDPSLHSTGLASAATDFFLNACRLVIDIE